MLALYDLGRLYSMEKSGLKGDRKSFEFYEKALQGFIQIEPRAKKIKPYLQYQIGMMYFKGLGTLVDNQKASECQVISLAGFIFSALKILKMKFSPITRKQVFKTRNFSEKAQKELEEKLIEYGFWYADENSSHIAGNVF